MPCIEQVPGLSETTSWYPTCLANLRRYWSDATSSNPTCLANLRRRWSTACCASKSTCHTACCNHCRKWCRNMLSVVWGVALPFTMGGAYSGLETRASCCYSNIHIQYLIRLQDHGSSDNLQHSKSKH